MPPIYCFDPTAADYKSKVRGVGRYVQILKENFPRWKFTSDLSAIQQFSSSTIFVNPFFNFLREPLAFRRIAKKQIAVIHDLITLKYPDSFPVGLKGKLNIFLNKLALRNYDLIVTDSEASKKDIVEILKVKGQKVKVIYPCLPKIFRQGSRLRWNDNVKIKQFNNLTIPSQFYLYVGDATWNKNLVNLAKAIKQINVTCMFVGKVFETMKKSGVEVAGFPTARSSGRAPAGGKPRQAPIFDNGWQQELKEFFTMAKDDKRFIFAGYVRDEQLVQLYQNARCNILVSRDEGFGFSYLEAASQQCPSVLSDIPVLHEISNNQGALFANPDKPTDIANIIGELYFNQDKRNTLGIAAQRRSEFFSPDSFKSGFKKILQF